MSGDTATELLSGDIKTVKQLAIGYGFEVLVQNAGYFLRVAPVIGAAMREFDHRGFDIS